MIERVLNPFDIELSLEEDFVEGLESLSSTTAAANILFSLSLVSGNLFRILVPLGFSASLRKLDKGKRGTGFWRS